MCNIVDLKCQKCSATVETHIADFCVEAESVHVYCPKHQKHAEADRAQRDCIVIFEGDSKGHNWTFVAPKEAHGICINYDPYDRARNSR